MDQYILWCENEGYVESDILSFIDARLVDCAVLRATTHTRMAREFYEQRPPPPYHYERAYWAFSATVQAQTRSGQLPARALFVFRNLGGTDSCRFGCARIEYDHHIFVTCPHTETYRASTIQALARDSGEIILRLPKPLRLHPTTVASCLFRDGGDIWPLIYSQYYLGHIPKIDPLICHHPELSVLERERVICGLHNVWHAAAIRCAGRIWGAALRKETQIRGAAETFRVGE